MTPPHSPLPWTYEANFLELVDSENHCIGEVYADHDAAFVLIAVNNHEKMRKALETIARKPIGAYDGARVREIARAALAGE